VYEWKPLNIELTGEVVLSFLTSPPHPSNNRFPDSKERSSSSIRGESNENYLKETTKEEEVENTKKIIPSTNDYLQLMKNSSLGCFP
jgi:hypothetical protein